MSCKIIFQNTEQYKKIKMQKKSKSQRLEGYIRESSHMPYRSLGG